MYAVVEFDVLHSRGARREAGCRWISRGGSLWLKRCCMSKILPVKAFVDLSQNFITSTTINTHADPPTKADIDEGFTRFGRWHIDCAMYNLEPPLITALRCLKLPNGPPQTIRWDDGSGTEMKGVRPGLTAFYSCEQLYEMLSEDEKAIVDNSMVQYAPHPYQ